jgi:hypothetical protein
MVVVNQSDLDAQLREFSQSIAAKAALFGKLTVACLRIECLRLTETLIRISPPRDKKKTEKNIVEDVGKKFDALGQGDSSDMGGRFSATTDKHGKDISGKRGRGEVRWLLWNHKALIGVAEEMDMRTASMEHLKDIHRSKAFTSKGRERRGKRGKQSVIVIRKRLTSTDTLKKLVEHLWGNIGRLKAGWLVAWKAVGGETAGKYRPPKWVMDHGGAGVRGGVDVANLQDAQVPSVRLWNTAKGSGSAKMREIASNALQLRIKSMAKRTVALIRLQAKDESAFQEVLAQDFE